MNAAPISVICRTKDRPVFLARALRSLAAQTEQGFSVVLVNDGGERGRVDEVVAASGLPQERILRVDHDHPRGRSAALEAGMDAATSPFIAIHDDDDTWEPSFLEATSAYLRDHPDAGAVFTRVDIVVERLVDGEPVEQERLPVWPEVTRISLARLAEENQGVPISVLYRREAIDRCGGFDASLPVVEDWDLHVRLVREGEVGFIDAATPLAHWHQRAGLEGDLGNSTLALADDHAYFDRLVRDRRLREWVNIEGAHNDGLLLYLGARFGEERRRHEDLVARHEQLRARFDEVTRRLDAAETTLAHLRQVGDELSPTIEGIARMGAETERAVARLNRALDKAATPIRLARRLRRR
ncbi:glycosyltransferase family 2 protein [Nanchangia anserum]|uniref:Glycosyltransferase family 2 protein n=1 Tax=Nanchangia anserum TaxID=2692125 RepID=A0A8I0KP82_9ACTO|nr:glycosyltransferase family A protein [Nanchangia anserum]MBD3690081.1 glycosyltransferase family 2 protein [Nanchangia anserum]QOX82127.1 glycosyltransferase family 2 protein [Nanchangia anserum]